jgi:hypothetical protein
VFTLEYLARALTVGRCNYIDTAARRLQIIHPGGHDHYVRRQAEKMSIRYRAEGSNCVSKTIKYLFYRPMNLVDLLAIVPFYIEEIVKLLTPGAGAGGLAVFRILRMARVFRIFKLGKHNSMMAMIVDGKRAQAPGGSPTHCLPLSPPNTFLPLLLSCTQS